MIIVSASTAGHPDGCASSLVRRTRQHIVPLGRVERTHGADSRRRARRDRTRGRARLALPEVAVNAADTVAAEIMGL